MMADGTLADSRGDEPILPMPTIETGLALGPGAENTTEPLTLVPLCLRHDKFRTTKYHYLGTQVPIPIT